MSRLFGMGSASEQMSTSSAREISGRKVVLCILLPPALIVGIGFVLLAPILTAKKEGHLYVGLRFEDEASVQFIDRNVANPMTRLDLFAGLKPPGETTSVASYEGLRKGKNIVETAALPNGFYQLVFTSPGYRPVVLGAELKDGEFIKSPAAMVPANVRLMDQFVGIVLEGADTPTLSPGPGQAR